MLTATAEYDDEGRRTSLRYPTHYTKPGSVYVANLGRKLLYGFDSAGRLSSVNQETGGSLISSVSYNAAWQVTSWTRVWEGVQNSTETFQFNDAGQLTRRGLVSGATLVDVEYRYPSTNNDGRLWQRKNHVSGEEVTYQYDELGRLSSAATTSSAWGLSWTFDGFGNRLQQSQTKGSPPQHSVAVNGLTNRMIGQAYDANGNMLITGLSYDVDNRLAGDGVYSYRYSSMNQRMRVSNATDTYAWFYGFEGEMLAVYKLEKENGDANKTWPVLQTARERVYAMGRLIRMGTSDVVVDRGASVIRHGSSNLAYYPYGEEQGGASANDRAKFATYTRDASTGLDYAWNRMYKVEWGRFTSADPFGGSGTTGNPGSWNRYSYVGGDPVGQLDPLGLAQCKVDNWVNAKEGRMALLKCTSIGGTESEYKWYWMEEETGSEIKRLEKLAEEEVGTYLDQREARTFFNRALSDAIEAIENNPECAAIFGKDLRDPVTGGVLDPVRVLKGIVHGSYGWMDFSYGPQDAEAETWGIGSVHWDGLLPYYPRVAMTINMTYWNMGLAVSQTALLLHELGHAMNFLAPGFGSQNAFEQNDGNDPAMSFRNDTLVRKKCLGGLK